MVVGRSANADVQLPGETVSREHAELFVDPFGRWWVRDLGSRNGTIINGEAVDEHLLTPGDAVQIEQFQLTLTLPSQSGRGPRRQPTTMMDAGLAVTDAGGDSISRLGDMRTPRIDASHLSTLTDFAGRLLATDDGDDRLQALCALMVGKPFNGNTAVAMRLARTDAADQDPTILCKPVSAKNWRSAEQPYVSRTMLRAMLADESPIVASNVPGGSGDVVEMSLVAGVMEMAAVMCPVRSDGESLDVLYVSFPAAYATGEWLALTALACDQYRQAEVAWEARRIAQEQAVVEEELRRAQRIQAKLIPSDVEVPGLDVAIGFEPCRWVGGDYTDVAVLPDGRVFLILCDVCGKGLQAALVTASLHSCVHMIVQTVSSLTQVVAGIDKYLCDTLPEESFVTAIAAVVDLATGELEYVNAGHPPAMIVDARANVRHLEYCQNRPLGYLPTELETNRTTLAAGDMLAMFTDGCTELPNEERRLRGIDGTDRCLADACRSADGRGIDEVGRCFKQSLTAHQGTASPQDDLTFLLVRRQ